MTLADNREGSIIGDLSATERIAPMLPQAVVIAELSAGGRGRRHTGMRRFVYSRPTSAVFSAHSMTSAPSLMAFNNAIALAGRAS